MIRRRQTCCTESRDHHAKASIHYMYRLIHCIFFGLLETFQFITILEIPMIFALILAPRCAFRDVEQESKTAPDVDIIERTVNPSNQGTPGFSGIRLLDSNVNATFYPSPSSTFPSRRQLVPPTPSHPPQHNRTTISDML